MFEKSNKKEKLVDKLKLKLNRDGDDDYDSDYDHPALYSDYSDEDRYGSHNDNDGKHIHKRSVGIASNGLKKDTLMMLPYSLESVIISRKAGFHCLYHY